MVFTADHVGDLHIPVVDHHAEVIGRRTVGTTNDQIIQFLVAEFDRTTDLVIEDYRAFLWVTETHHVRLVVSMAALAIAAVAVVTRFFTVFHLLFTQRFQTFLRAIAFISSSLHQHVVNHRVITVKTLGLEVRAFVPIQV
ncbi:hypothetical protein D3C72_1784100 [compost metagenome]